MPHIIDVHEAQARMEDLLERTEAGESFIISREGGLVAELRPVTVERVRFGGMKDMFGPDPDAAFTPEADAEIDWKLDEPIDPDER